jgi:HK97 gp10 family phage protein
MSDNRVAVKIEGTEELLKALRALGTNVDKSVKGATRAGGKVILGAARSNAKALTSRSGKIVEEKKVIQAGNPVQMKVRKRTGFAVASITPAKGYGHLRLLEYGAQPHTINGKPLLRFFSGGKFLEVRSVQHPGFAARPWLRPAVDARKDEAIQAVSDSLAQTLEQAKIEAEGSDE